jgi:hypothetical protein
MFDLDDLEPTYTDIILNIEYLRNEAVKLDSDSLIDEISGVVHNIIGETGDKINMLTFKVNSGGDLTEEDLEFLRNVYVTYYVGYTLVLDEEYETEV